MRSAVILPKDQNSVKKISAKDYGIINIGRTKRTVKINEVLPFRVRFTNIGLTGYNANSPAPIGIAIVGFNNYIL
jgi:hypothetical protein